MAPCTRGFTLIELLVVLAIVSTLLMLVVPRYFEREQVAREAVLRDNLRTVRETLDRFHADRGRYPDSLQELVDTRYLRALPVDPLTGSSTTWELQGPPEGEDGGVHELRSGAPGVARDGSAYADW